MHTSAYDLLHLASAGWLTDFTNWLRQAITDFFQSLIAYFGDFLLILVENQLTLFALVIESLPEPGFLQTYNLATILGPAGPTVAWAMSTFRVGEGLAVIGAGYAFRLLRKFLTIFQW